MTDDDPAPACAEALMALIPIFTGAMIEEVRKVEQPTRLTPPQARVLKLLTKVPYASLTEVADHLGVRKPTASVLVLKMVSQGLISRTPAGATRIALALTETGRAAIETLQTALAGRMQTAIQRLTREECVQVLAAATLLNRVFGEEGGD